MCFDAGFTMVLRDEGSWTRGAVVIGVSVGRAQILRSRLTRFYSQGLTVMKHSDR